MPAKDIYHDTVKNALIKDGWTITHDPLKLQLGKRKFFVDLGAEKLIAAVKDSQEIAVEIKSFISNSEMNDLENALGQYVLYENVMRVVEPNRVLFLAVADNVFENIFEDVIGQLLLENEGLKVCVFNPETEEIVKWIK
ncbi:MAG: XisH family protein [Pyrinomonadaceae bacterium]|nr:XisH family protein [Pyrinomonadaceae bacterium]